MTDAMKNTELNEAELDQVQGGIGLLLPAVQAAREPASIKAAGTSAKGDPVPTEDFSLNFERIKFDY
tara:strand:+ start:1653 stop:1853 length:201 start_codon:yes stop_codon:yes gene_type:complete